MVEDYPQEPEQEQTPQSRYLTNDILQREAQDTRDISDLNLNYGNRDAEQSRWELDSADLIEDMIHILKCHRRNKDGEWKEQVGLKPLLNDDGINELVVVPFQTIGNKNTYLSNIPEKIINREICDFEIQIAKLMAMNHKRYEFAKDKRDYILELIVLYFANALYRAEGGGERRGRWSTEIRKYIFGNMKEGAAGAAEKKKSGLFGVGFMGL